MDKKRRDKKGRVLRTGEAQRADGRYMFRYNDEAGVRRTIYSWRLVETDEVPSQKKNDTPLRVLEQEIQRDLADNIRTYDASTTSLNDQFETFMEMRSDLSETTRCGYKQLYDKHIRPTLGHRNLRSIKSSEIRKVYISMVQQNGLKFSTIASTNSVVKQLFEMAVMDGLLRINPAVSAMKETRRACGQEQEKRHALTIEEQERFIQYVYNSRKYQRLGPFFTVMLGTGMRVGETLGLRWCDCDFKKNVIHVTHALLYKQMEGGGYGYRISSTKTKAGVRDIPMMSDVKAALKKERARPPVPNAEPFEVDGYSGFVFINNAGKVYTQSFIYDSIQHIAFDYNHDEVIRAKKEKRDPIYLPKFSSHSLRHTFCTRLCENETNLKSIQEIMGHKQIKTTMEVYSEATAEVKKKTLNTLEGVVKLA